MMEVGYMVGVLLVRADFTFSYKLFVQLWKAEVSYNLFLT